MNEPAHEQGNSYCRSLSATYNDLWRRDTENLLPLAIGKVAIDIQAAQRPLERIDRPVPVFIEFLEMFV